MTPENVLCALLIFCVAYEGAHCRTDGYDVVLSELAPAVQEDFLMFAAGDSNFTNTDRGCIGGPPDTTKVMFLLYNEDHVETPILLDNTNLHLLNPERPIVYIIHGWVAGANVIGIPTLRYAYLDEDISNVIVIDWSKMGWGLYTQTYCYVPYVAEHIAQFMFEISDFTNIPLSKFHLVGHSLGAQISGFVGKTAISARGEKIGRITGLDPAGPLYQIVSEKKRLCSADADFVEIVHSNAGITGYLGLCGTIDYHLNCGTLQPLCILNRDINPDAKISTIVCDHLRSIFVWAEGVHSNQFIGKGCRRCPGLIIGTCSTNSVDPQYFSMGALNPPGNNYNIPTYHSPPYAKGCSAFPGENCV